MSVTDTIRPFCVQYIRSYLICVRNREAPIRIRSVAGWTNTEKNGNGQKRTCLFCFNNGHESNIKRTGFYLICVRCEQKTVWIVSVSCPFWKQNGYVSHKFFLAVLEVLKSPTIKSRSILEWPDELKTLVCNSRVTLVWGWVIMNCGQWNSRWTSKRRVSEIVSRTCSWYTEINSEINSKEENPS